MTEHGRIDRRLEIHERHYCDPPLIHTYEFSEKGSMAVTRDAPIRAPKVTINYDVGTRFECPCGRVFKVANVPDRIYGNSVMVGGLRWVPIGWFESLKRKVFK